MDGGLVLKEEDEQQSFFPYLCPISIRSVMKKQSIKRFISLVALLILQVQVLFAQCSVCTKTAEQLGEKPGKGLNAGILYLMLIPLVSICIVGYRFIKRERSVAQQ